MKAVHKALALLLQEHTAAAGAKPRIPVTGQQVVVGGGNVAMSCVRTVLGAGAGEVRCVYRRDADSLPCNREEYENAVEEGGQFLFCSAPVEVPGNPDGRVRAIRLIRTELGDAGSGGRKPFRKQLGKDFEVAADGVFLALGFEAVSLPQDDPVPALARHSRELVAVGEDRRRRSRMSLWVGDLVRGTRTVLEAVRDARRAVKGIEAHLVDCPRPAAAPAAGALSGLQ